MALFLDGDAIKSDWKEKGLIGRKNVLGGGERSGGERI